ncbi:MAG: tetratricopeptide repeat protein [Candidatus Cloacimonetes bacterium]|nr:tetratricopeptide repeat protein [Candidatus Cloacimonadota bacterium]
MLYSKDLKAKFWKRLIVVFLFMLIINSFLFAIEKVAVLDFEKSDKASDYVSKAIMNRDLKKIFSDYDEYELIDKKIVSKSIKKAGYTNIFFLGKQDISIIGNQLGADIVIWGNVQSLTSSEFKIIANLWSKKSDNVTQISFNVTKSTTERVKAFQENLLDKLEEFSHGEADKLLGIALQHFKSQNYDSAEEIFLQILEIDDSKIEPNFYLGLLNFKKDEPDYEKSIQYYNKGLEIDPNNLDLLNYLSITYFQTENYEEAIATLEKMSEIEDNKEIWLKIGRIYHDIEEFENAKEAFDNAIAIDEDYSEAYKEVALLLYTDLEEFEEAIPYFEKTITFFPDDESLEKKLAKCYHKAGKLDSAIIQYKKMIQEQPENKTAYFNLAGALRITNKLPEAIEVLISLKNIDAENPKVYNRLADVYFANDEINKSKTEAESAIQIDDSSPEPYKILARIYQSIGYKKYEQFLELEEKIPGLYGEEANKAVIKRDKLKASAHKDFLKSMEYLNTALTKNPSSSVIKDIEKSKVTLKKLIKATKAWF